MIHDDFRDSLLVPVPYLEQSYLCPESGVFSTTVARGVHSSGILQIVCRIPVRVWLQQRSWLLVRSLLINVFLQAFSVTRGHLWYVRNDERERMNEEGRRKREKREKAEGDSRQYCTKYALTVTVHCTVAKMALCAGSSRTPVNSQHHAEKIRATQGTRHDTSHQKTSHFV